MAQYKISFTVTDSNIRSVQKKVAEAFGKEAGAQVEKIDLARSRADRLSQAESTFEDAKGEVESLRDELQEWRDGLPENLQSGSKAEELDEAISALEEILSSMDSCEFSSVSFPSMY